ncbi:hypothetical protein 2 [Changjiang tombus-like virus 22]|uniref:hypothetical protein 2 n=1 Tax=Changjiang tombus-like virus 22 TaxID=1922816 RepID=UPI00090C1284|nr:hypothetical protein 2 [Changjiang tombus-like virus 22]APG76278.1 hypothetical protein 2 [Changjiang tombus-like virus 22]
MLFSVGCHMDGAALPTPDITSSHTLLAGVAARFATQPPRPDDVLMGELEQFVLRWLEENLTPLSADCDVSFDSWVAGCNQPDWRKAELREAFDSWVVPESKHFDVKMFMKKESYTDWKHGRAINSRTDAFKTMVGPFFSAIEHEVFKRPEFIKKVPVTDRASYVYHRLYRTNGHYYSSDFTSFEALFTRRLMEIVEFSLYRHMTKHLPSGGWFMGLISRVLLGKNKIKNRHMSLEVEATRMSGEMCTSLGNGFSNLMFNLFVASKSGVDIDGVVEGDDGLFVTSGQIDDSLFEKLGLIIKIERHEDPSTASFCGQIFDPQNFVVITDPRKVLASAGWIDGKYLGAKRGKQLGLLRAKAWSFGYQYPECPIVSAMARALLRLTRSMDHRVVFKTDLGWWLRKEYQAAFDHGRPELNRPVRDETRSLMHKVFGVSPDTQREIEAWFDNLQEIRPFPSLDVPESWKEYFQSYVVRTLNTDWADLPPESWNKDYCVVLPAELDPG